MGVSGSFMSTFFEFVAAHWVLTTAFVIAFVWLIIEEAKHQGLGGARQTPQGVTYLINQLQAQVVDLRDPAAFQDGCIVGSLNIPYARLEQSLDKLKRLKNNPIVLVCSMGQQSVPAMHKLRKQGFEQLFVLGGGIAAWRRAGLPLKKA